MVLKDITLIIYGVIVGFIVGGLAAICAVPLWMAIRRFLSRPNIGSLIALIFFVGYFGVFGVGGILWFGVKSWPVLLGAGIAFGYLISGMYKKE